MALIRDECGGSISPMAGWTDFAAEAPRIAGVFAQRHAANGHLCMLATTRSDGYPRISPMEPAIFDGQLVLVGMPGNTKFRDLARDPRFCLHTATIDPQVGDGDAKLWGQVRDVPDLDLHRRFADHLYADTGFDLRGQVFAPLYVGDLVAASCLEIIGGVLTITSWKPGAGERVLRKD
jgi:hypothetical protein